MTKAHVQNDSSAMIRVAGGSFMMGSAEFYAEEAPVRRVEVGAFFIDPTPVTNVQFAAFVADTGYVTLAEIPPDPDQYPGILPEMMVAGSIVFVPPALGSRFSYESWWHYVPGAHWRQPYGPQTEVSDLPDHPVVQIAYQDAQAYAAWAGKRLLTDVEAECAARGGLEAARYAWGEELAPNGQLLANVWLEGFPVERPGRPGPPYTTPVKSFPANAYGLFDMIGNVWEWTATDASGPPGNNSCCGASPQAMASGHMKVLKGGSHLCAPNHCQRYRPAAKWFQPVDTSTTHVGFRCAMDIEVMA